MQGITFYKKSAFGALVCNVYIDKVGNIYMTREQIGRALEYANPKKAIENIHAQHRDRLDSFSVTLKTRATDGKMYEKIFYTRRGVYEICRYSRQPKADEFYDYVYDLLEGLATGQLIIKAEKSTPAGQEARAKNKIDSKAFNEAVKRLADYAAANGSHNAARYYTNMNKLINSISEIYNRDNAGIKGMEASTAAMKICTVCIRDCIEKGMSYKDVYRECKHRLNTMKAWGGLLTA